MKRAAYFKFLSVTLLLVIAVACTKDETVEDSKPQLITSFVNDINADSLQATVQWLEDMGTRFMLADNRREVAVDLRDRFKRLGYPNAKLDSFFVSRTFRGTDYNIWQYNVVASTTGSVYADSVIVFGAHYDNILSLGEGDPFTFNPGANDNASGVAATMEMARLFKAKNYNLKYSMQFVLFAAEELGLYGGKDFAQKAYDNDEKIKLMINYDMIGVPKSTDKSRWIVNVVYYNNSINEAAKAKAACSEYSSIGSYSDNSFSDRSDSYPFVLKGYKPLFFIQDNLDGNYHTANDLTTHMNFDYCREIVKASCAMILEYNY